MSPFDKAVEGATGGALLCAGIETIQVNLGLVCNQGCIHCHVSAGPGRSEAMDLETMSMVLRAVALTPSALVDLTGGAPELNPDFRWFVESLCSGGVRVQVRTNLTAMLLPGMERLPEFLAKHRVRLAASMPCYLEENVRAQRGVGVYEGSVEVIRRLNAQGYGKDPDLPLDLVYNPGGAFLPPNQAALEADYRRELMGRFGLFFTRLLTITNMPIGRFGHMADEEGMLAYIRMLEGSFNPYTLDGLMCRRQVSIGWDGTLYDCDFNLALGLPVNHGAPGHVQYYDPKLLTGREVVTGEHCFGCTAGCGSSCKGAIEKHT
jgi:radical SAM/Cys-rich protein